MKLSFGVFAAAIMLGGAAACSSTYPLVAGGGDGIGTTVGDVEISDAGSTLEVTVTITEDLTPEDSSDDSAVTKIYQLHAEANCLVTDFPLTNKGAPQVGRFELNIPYLEGVREATVEIPKPDCGDDPILVGVHADVEKQGGLAAVDSLFPAPVQFSVSIDPGSDEGASYFDTLFTGDSVLSGLEIDGYCVDVGHTIGINTVYSAIAYSYLEEDFAGTNIDKPEHMDSVAWVINNFVPGTSYTADVDGDGVSETYTLSSGTLQRAIWYIIDNDQTTAGLGAFDDAWANYIANLALEEGVGYEPGCGDLVPIVLIPDDSSVQHTTIQTTFAALDVPCESIGETAWAVMPGMTEPLGFQFSSANWFTYVEFSAFCGGSISTVTRNWDVDFP